jgi:mxaJ protein
MPLKKSHLAAFIVGSSCAAASAGAAESTVLKVCAAENEMPYSNRKGEGFENGLTELLGKQTNRSIEYVFWKDPRYYVRDFLNKGLCDVVIGLDTGDPRVATTIPYYRSAYTFVSRQRDNLDLRDWDADALRTADRIGFVPGTPSEVMMRSIGRYNDMFNYIQELVGFKSRRNQYVKYDPAKLVGDVSGGRAKLAVLWGPSAARYVKASTIPLTMTVIADDNTRLDGEKVDFHFSTSMAVRKNETGLLEELNHFIKHNQKPITELLEKEGIPILPEPKQAWALNKKDKS